MRNINQKVLILTVDEAKLDLAKHFAQMVFDNPELLLEGTPIPRFDNMAPREVAEMHGELNLGEPYMFVMFEDDTGRVRDNLELVLIQIGDWEYVTSWDVKNQEPAVIPESVLPSIAPTPAK